MSEVIKKNEKHIKYLKATFIKRTTEALRYSTREYSKIFSSIKRKSGVFRYIHKHSETLRCIQRH